MKPSSMTARLSEYICRTSGHQRNRNLGTLHMSQLHRCDRVLYREFFEPDKIPDARTLALLKRGNDWEPVIKSWLTETGILVPKSECTVVAPFDVRLLGNIDGVTPDGELVEIKTLQQEELDELKAGRSLRPKRLWQIQAYLRYLPAEYGVLIAVSVNYDVHVVGVRRNDRFGDEIERKAKSILAAIDRRQIPDCRCGHCGQNGGGR